MPTLRQFPRLLLLDRALPRAVPILMADHSIVRGLVKEARRLGALAADRELVWWNSAVTYTADEMYYAGELYRRSENEPWGSGVNKTNPNACAWALSMPRTLLQGPFVDGWQRNGTTRRVLVVHRSDAKSRRVNNHADMIGALRQHFSDSPVPTEVLEFVGSAHNVSETAELWTGADVVLAPHGAALSFVAFMRPKTAIVEIGYPGTGGMPYPAPFYMAIAASVDVAFYMTMAMSGSYGGKSEADVEDVVRTVAKALRETVGKEDPATTGTPSGVGARASGAGGRVV